MTLLHTCDRQASCSLTTMSSANSFAALTSPAPVVTPTPPFGDGFSILGSKRPRSPSSSPPKAPWAPPVSLPVDKVPDGSEYSVFNIQNMFRHCWFINRDHLIANVLSATQDDEGCFTWVDFLSQFHTLLIKCMCTLLPPRVAVSCGKKVLFVFLLEILTGDEGPKLEVFWHACKKHSRASQATCKAKRATKASNPPAPVPSIPTPTPCETTSLGYRSDLSMEENVKMVRDVVMWAITPSPLKPTPDPFFPASNQDFARSFTRQIGDTAPIRAWCVKAH
jgi:hypothetical protein